MKEKVESLVKEDISPLGVYVVDSFIDTEEGKKRFNIVLDSDDYIDLNKITEASRIINKILDKEKNLIEDIDEVDIYSKEKGDN